MSMCRLCNRIILLHYHSQVQEKWIKSSNWNEILDPLNEESFIKVSEVDESEIKPFVESLSKCPKHGLHNPFKSPKRYLLYGDVSAGHMLSLPEVSDFFTKLYNGCRQRVINSLLLKFMLHKSFWKTFPVIRYVSW